MRAVLAGLILAAALCGPAPAQPGSTVGLPADPFASNYPSEPPPRLRPVPRAERGTGRLRHRPRSGTRGPVPPAVIPGR